MNAERTPAQLVAELDRYIVGQDRAKRAVAVAVRNRWRRQRVPEGLREEVLPKNIILIGPTGVGKTEIARRLAGLTAAPFAKVEATRFTEVGYVGRDVEGMIRDLAEASYKLVRDEAALAMRDKAQTAANERILDALLPLPGRAPGATGDEDEEGPGDEPRGVRTRRRLGKLLEHGMIEEREIEVEIREAPGFSLNMFGAAGVEQFGMDMNKLFERIAPAKSHRQTLTVREARAALLAQETERLIDPEKLQREAVARAEQAGIVFIDEIDKVVAQGKSQGPDVSRQGVQRDLLPLVEGSSVTTRLGPVRTEHILFIAAGAFHAAKPADLIPELQGRFPIRVELDPLTETDLLRILQEPDNALPRQYAALLATEGVDLSFEDGALEELAASASRMNRDTQDIGARRLHTVMEVLLEELLFKAPELPPDKRNFRLDRGAVRDKLAGVIEDEDLRKMML